jgi:hypothetical protein
MSRIPGPGRFKIEVGPVEKSRFKKPEIMPKILFTGLAFITKIPTFCADSRCQNSKVQGGLNYRAYILSRAGPTPPLVTLVGITSLPSPELSLCLTERPIPAATALHLHRPSPRLWPYFLRSPGRRLSLYLQYCTATAAGRLSLS